MKYLVYKYLLFWKIPKGCDCYIVKDLYLPRWGNYWDYVFCPHRKYLPRSVTRMYRCELMEANCNKKMCGINV
jgi:hypothetical protein